MIKMIKNYSNIVMTVLLIAGCGTEKSNLSTVGAFITDDKLLTTTSEVQPSNSATFPIPINSPTISSTPMPIIPIPTGGTTYTEPEVISIPSESPKIVSTPFPTPISTIMPSITPTSTPNPLQSTAVVVNNNISITIPVTTTGTSNNNSSSTPTPTSVPTSTPTPIISNSPVNTAVVQQNPIETVTNTSVKTDYGKILLQSQYSSGLYDILLINTDGTGATNLTNSNYNVVSSSISPDASKVIFTSSGKQDGSYMINSDGSNKITLSNYYNNGYKPLWTKDSSKFLLPSLSINNGTKIYSGNKNSSNLSVIFDKESNFNGFDLSIKNKLVFSSDYKSSLDFEIYTMNFDGTDLTKLTNNQNGYSASPKWSPDGSKIAFISYENGKNALYLINDDSSNLIKITDNNNLGIREIQWSPDGSKIAFYSEESPCSIYSVSIDGTNLMKITRGWFPKWSPDGSKISYSNTNDSSKIYIMNPNGTFLKKLSDYSGFILDWINK